MRFVGGGEEIEVMTIGVGKMGLNVVTCRMGSEGIRVSMMRFGVMVHTGVT